MAKKFVDLKVGDTIYMLSAYTYSAGAEKINCEEAYKELNMSFGLAVYPALSDIIYYEVTEIKSSPISGSDRTVIYIKSIPGDRITLINPYKLDKTFIRPFSPGCHYDVFGVEIDSLKEKMEKIIHAMEVVNKNVMVVKSNKYKEMLKKLIAI